ncbi:unnamed protein product [Echinostoma caproni]|uniref:Uncharacterized protein n=1 Tax=Echinostoma caproni TaxID=27848 RepID=A0A183BFX3_9TREM|nr:unnamed protein product [Echinostoma caproni]
MWTPHPSHRTRAVVSGHRLSCLLSSPTNP